MPWTQSLPVQSQVSLMYVVAQLAKTAPPNITARWAVESYVKPKSERAGGIAVGAAAVQLEPSNVQVSLREE